MELALRLMYPDARTVAFCEIDLAAIKVLVARMEDGSLDPAPIWNDVSTFDGRPWADVVDIVTVSPPCQPFSVAGQRKGTADERWIWPDIWRCIREVGPRFIFAENTPGLIRHGLPVMLGDFAAAGFDVAWDVFSAAEAGAPHQRDRVFILAHAERAERGQGHAEGRSTQRQHDLHGGRPESPGGTSERREAVAHAGRPSNGSVQHQSGAGWPTTDAGEGGTELGYAEHGPERTENAGRVLRRGVAVSGEALGNANSKFQEQQPAIAEGTQHAAPECAGRLFPPGRDDDAGWRQWLEVHPGTEPAIWRSAAGTAGQMDRLLGIGNSVVPIVAATAFVRLAETLGIEVMG